MGVLVDLGLVLDLLGTVGVSQRAERLVIVVVGGGEARYHHRLGVAAQRVPDGRRERKGGEGGLRSDQVWVLGRGSVWKPQRL